MGRNLATLRGDYKTDLPISNKGRSKMQLLQLAKDNNKNMDFFLNYAKPKPSEKSSFTLIAEN